MTESDGKLSSTVRTEKRLNETISVLSAQPIDFLEVKLNLNLEALHFADNDDFRVESLPRLGMPLGAATLWGRCETL